MAEFKDRIKELRTMMDLSQDDLARKLDVTKQTVSQYERGIRRPDMDSAIALADIFNVSIDYLYGVEDRTPLLLAQDELQLIDKYRQADDLTKMMIAKLLGGA